MGATDLFVGQMMGEMAAEADGLARARKLVAGWRRANEGLQHEVETLREQLGTVIEERNQAESRRNGLLCVREGYREGARFLERRFKEIGVPEDEIKRFMDQFRGEIDKKRDEMFDALEAGRLKPEDLF